MKPINGLVAAEWDVQSISHGEIEHFCRLWHYSHSAPNTATYRHGLVYVSTWQHLGGVIWIPPMKSAAVALVGEDSWQGVLSCSRLVVAPECPTNAASFLLGRSMRLIDRERWPVLVTYADTRLGHTGAIYRATNWRCDGEVPAGDVWVNAAGEQRGRKRGGRTLLASQMRDLGFVRAEPMPKIRFVHDVRVTP
jgi:hypothetical protein